MVARSSGHVSPSKNKTPLMLHAGSYTGTSRLRLMEIQVENRLQLPTDSTDEAFSYCSRQISHSVQRD